MDHERCLEYFRSVPWVAEILSQPGTNTFVPSHRDTTSDRRFRMINSQDKLLAQSLNTPSAIPHCIGFYRDDAVAKPTPAGDAVDPNQTFLIRQATLLFDLQTGTKGFSGTIHGGLDGVLVDEAMGNLMYVSNIMHQGLKLAGRMDALASNVVDINSVLLMTASINIRFLKPLTLPRVVAVVATLTKIEGRRIFMDVTIEGEQGVVFVKASGEWRVLPLPKKKL